MMKEMNDRTTDPPRVLIRRPEPEDASSFLVLMQESRSLHAPWVSPPLTEEDFARYLASRDGIRQDGFLVCCRQTGAIAGVINLNEIVRGCFQSACLGYYATAPFAGKGLMREGLRQVIGYAFGALGLHRLEANIQPENRASLALVRSCGFSREGYSPRYLRIGEKWCDHERWALLADAGSD